MINVVVINVAIVFVIAVKNAVVVFVIALTLVFVANASVANASAVIVNVVKLVWESYKHLGQFVNVLVLSVVYLLLLNDYYY